MVATFAAFQQLQPEAYDSERLFEDTLKKQDERLNGANPMLSEDAALRLAQIGFPAVTILSDALMSESLYVAVNAARAIGIIGSDAKSAVFNLTWILRHPEKERRESAACALGRIRTNSRLSVEALAYALSDTEVSVRQYAAAALGEFDGESLSYKIKELQLAVTDEDPNVSVFSKYALSKTVNYQKVKIKRR